MDNPVTVHEINELSVVTDESYTDFVAGLQQEISESLAPRPRKASVGYFRGKTVATESAAFPVTEKLATSIYFHLVQNGYVDEDGHVTEKYKEDKAAGALARPTADPLKTVIDVVWPLVDSLYLDLPLPTDDRKPKQIPLNEANFSKKEFQALWSRINHTAVYQVEFDSNELIAKCIQAIDKQESWSPPSNTSSRPANSRTRLRPTTSPADLDSISQAPPPIPRRRLRTRR